jgi:Xaa-Pro aminopeptidase
VVSEARDPCVLPKAIKNPVEQAGQRAAQARDGGAVARFLHWLSVEGPKGEVTELSAAEALHQFRRDCGDLRDLSFDTISGAGPNGAIVHYRVSEETNRTLALQRLSGRFGRAVSRWHHRHHPHRLDRAR